MPSLSEALIRFFEELHRRTGARIIYSGTRRDHAGFATTYGVIATYLPSELVRLRPEEESMILMGMIPLSEFVRLRRAKKLERLERERLGELEDVISALGVGKNLKEVRIYSISHPGDSLTTPQHHVFLRNLSEPNRVYHVVEIKPELFRAVLHGVVHIIDHEDIKPPEDVAAVGARGYVMKVVLRGGKPEVHSFQLFGGKYDTMEAYRTLVTPVVERELRGVLTNGIYVEHLREGRVIHGLYALPEHHDLSSIKRAVTLTERNVRRRLRLP